MSRERTQSGNKFLSGGYSTCTFTDPREGCPRAVVPNWWSMDHWWSMVTFWVVHRMSTVFGNKLKVKTSNLDDVHKLMYVQQSSRIQLQNQWIIRQPVTVKQCDNLDLRIWQRWARRQLPVASEQLRWLVVLPFVLLCFKRFGVIIIGVINLQGKCSLFVYSCILWKFCLLERNKRLHNYSISRKVCF